MVATKMFFPKIPPGKNLNTILERVLKMRVVWKDTKVKKK
jgi:hypothetical protein